jgi:thioester reductase-like protein
VQGASYEAFLNSKVVAVGGDITKDGLALSPADAEAVHSQVQVILNCAANVDFNERLDGALTTNCRGPLRLLGLAKSCTKLRAYVHVSTAYVNCNQPNGTVSAAVSWL